MSELTKWRSLHGDSFAGSRALVTGGAGFIGSHITHALVELGAKVTVLDDVSGGSWDNLAGLDVEHCEGSILDQKLLQKCADGKQYVFHLAAKGSVPHSVAEPRIYNDVNDGGTLNVLEAARNAKAQRVCYSASSSAYGDDPTLPKIETMAPKPMSPYAATKLAGEGLCSAWSASYGLDTVCLRYFNIFGPRQNANSAYAAVIAAFASALLAGKHPTIFGDGEQSRDFTYVDNVVHANLLGARSAKTLGGNVFNVGCGMRVSVNDLAREMAKVLGREDLTPVYKDPRAGDVKHSLADISRTREALGYEPLVDFRKGLGVTLKWYAAQSQR
jgi:nucleoside-diphosphate-sugar epimerase